MSARNSYNVAPIPGDNNGGSGGGGGGGGNNPSADGGVPIGTVVPFASSTTPAKWLLCNGSEVRNDIYPDLYTTIGYNFGTAPGVILQSVVSYSTPSTSTITFSQPTIGNSFVKVGTYLRLSDFTAISGPNINGTIVVITVAPAIGATGTYSATFTTPLSATGNGGVGTLNRYSIPLPDLRLASPVGALAGTLAFASTGGASTVVITADNLPQHTHQVYVPGNTALTSGSGQTVGFPNTTAVDATTVPSQTRLNNGTTLATNSAVNIRNPYVGMNYIIKAET